jgi:hypothetical protein
VADFEVDTFSECADVPLKPVSPAASRMPDSVAA